MEINKIIQLRLRIREGAPLNKLKLTLPADQNATYLYAYIDGRFDILSKEDIENEMLLRTTEYNPKFLDKDRWSNLVSCEQIESGYRTLVQNKFVELTNKTGQTIAVPKRKARLIKLTKRS